MDPQQHDAELLAHQRALDAAAAVAAVAAQHQADEEQAAADAEEAEAHAAAARAAGADAGHAGDGSSQTYDEQQSLAQHGRSPQDGLEHQQTPEEFVVAAAAAAAAAARNDNGSAGHEHHAMLPQHTQHDESLADTSRSRLSGAGQSKRRKINTCLPCKRRKVRCDKVKPHCGQCKKHNIDEAECTWSVDVDPAFQPQPSLATDMYDSSWYAPPANDNASASSSTHGGVWNGEVARLNDEYGRLAERNQRLEAALAHTLAQLAGSSGDAGSQSDPLAVFEARGNAVGSTTNGHSSAEAGSPNGEYAAHRVGSLSQELRSIDEPDGQAGALNGLSGAELERGIAADALAMIARHHTGLQNGFLDFDALKTAAAASSDAGPSSRSRFPFSTRLTETLLRDALHLLPRDEKLFGLLEAEKSLQLNGFSTGVSHRLIDLQLEAFRSELEHWQQSGSETSLPTLDVTFLALLFFLAAVGVECTEPHTLMYNQVVRAEADVEELTDTYRTMGQTLLSAVDFMEQPNLNVLMCLATIRQHALMRGRFNEHASLAALTMRACAALGLDRLGSAYDDQMRWLSSPPPTPRQGHDRARSTAQITTPFWSTPEPRPEAATCHCVLPERSHLVREAGRRLFAVSKMHMDLWAAEAGMGFDEPRAGGTKLPLNIDEAELPDGSGPDPFILPDETKHSSPTRNTLLLHLERVASLVRELKAAPPATQREPAFVLELHAKGRQIIDDLPAFLRLDGESESSERVRALVARQPHLAAQRLILAEAVHFCLLTLHRPFLMHDSDGPDSNVSVKASVESARRVISCVAELERTVWAARKFSTFRRHSHSAATVLALHLLDCARRGIEEPLAAAMREDIDAALAHASDGASTLVRALLTEAARRAPGKPNAPGAPLNADAPMDDARNVEQRNSQEAPALATSATLPASARPDEAASLEEALQALDSSRSVELYFAQLLSASVPHSPPEDLWSTLDRALLSV